MGQFSAGRAVIQILADNDQLKAKLDETKKKLAEMRAEAEKKASNPVGGLNEAADAVGGLSNAVKAAAMVAVPTAIAKSVVGVVNAWNEGREKVDLYRASVARADAEHANAVLRATRPQQGPFGESLRGLREANADQLQKIADEAQAQIGAIQKRSALEQIQDLWGGAETKEDIEERTRNRIEAANLVSAKAEARVRKEVTAQSEEEIASIRARINREGVTRMIAEELVRRQAAQRAIEKNTDPQVKAQAYRQEYAIQAAFNSTLEQDRLRAANNTQSKIDASKRESMEGEVRARQEEDDRIKAMERDRDANQDQEAKKRMQAEIDAEKEGVAASRAFRERDRRDARESDKIAAKMGTAISVEDREKLDAESRAIERRRAMQGALEEEKAAIAEIFDIREKAAAKFWNNEKARIKATLREYTEGLRQAQMRGFELSDLGNGVGSFTGSNNIVREMGENIGRMARNIGRG